MDQLRLDSDPSARYVFGYRVGAKTVADVGSAPTRALSSEDADGFFTGVFNGLYAHNGADATMAPADVDWFDYQPLD